jgi:hypothetical protein
LPSAESFNTPNLCCLWNERSLLDTVTLPTKSITLFTPSLFSVHSFRRVLCSRSPSLCWTYRLLSFLSLRVKSVSTVFSPKSKRSASGRAHSRWAQHTNLTTLRPTTRGELFFPFGIFGSNFKALRSPPHSTRALVDGEAEPGRRRHLRRRIPDSVRAEFQQPARLLLGFGEISSSLCPPPSWVLNCVAVPSSLTSPFLIRPSSREMCAIRVLFVVSSAWSGSFWIPNWSLSILV